MARRNRLNEEKRVSELRKEPENKDGGGIALAFVGAVVPDEPRFRTSAFSQAGQMYQQELLVGLQRAGLPASAIISVMPIASRRHGEMGRRWFGGGDATRWEGMSIKFVPFINVTPLKQISIGIGTAIELLRWGWRNRLARFRVVYCYNLSVPPGIFILLSAWLIGARTIVSLCDIDVPGETVPDTLFWKLDYWMQRRLIQHFDGHVVVSDVIARDFLNGKPHLRLEGGVRPEDLNRTNGHEFSATTQDGEPLFVIAAVGHLNETNGLPVLLEAFSLLRGKRFRLRIAGAGPLDEQVRAAAARDPRIEFLGLLSFEGVLKIYSSSSVLINMRITKSRNTKYFFPSKMMEYLASGVPVISTCTGHVEEEFGAFTYLLREETPKALCELIEYVAALDPDERQKTGQRARAYMAACKTWAAQTRKLAEFIRGTVLQSRVSF
jgi:glycosyltransferase involved in cell wall biosynthesis